MRLPKYKVSYTESRTLRAKIGLMEPSPPFSESRSAVPGTFRPTVRPFGNLPHLTARQFRATAAFRVDPPVTHISNHTQVPLSRQM